MGNGEICIAEQCVILHSLVVICVITDREGPIVILDSSNMLVVAVKLHSRQHERPDPVVATKDAELTSHQTLEKLID